MSTNKTPNYNLHSWLPQDEFHLTEINENFAKLDVALKIEATAATQKANALETALGQRVRMVTGSYVGQGSSTTSEVTLGFKPRAVIVVNTRRGISGPDMSFLALENGPNNNAIVLTDTGFIAKSIDGASYMSASNTTYHYAAFY